MLGGRVVECQSTLPPIIFNAKDLVTSQSWPPTTDQTKLHGNSYYYLSSTPRTNIITMILFTRYYSFLVVGLISSRAALGFVLPSHRATISSSTTSFTRSSETTTSYVKSPPPSSAYWTTTQLFGWGPDPIWSTAFVESIIQACPSGSCVSLKVNVDDGSEFIYPGQYVQVKPVGGTYSYDVRGF